MIHLITAVPGSGKTLYAIGVIEAALLEGRPVYTNISGLIREKFPNSQLLHDAPDDWRDTPEGAVVVYDEAQQPHLYPSNAQRGPVTDERLTAMETHRHTGHDLWFITQAPTFVHHHIRKLVGLHVHLYRARGVQGATKYEWSHVCDSPNDRREQERADMVLWPFPKQHFGYYTSAVMHTHKFRVPRKLLFIGVLIVGLLLAAVFLGLSAVSGFTSATENPGVVEAVKQAQAATAPPASTYSWSSSPQAVPVAGCIANESASRCMCFSQDGATLDIAHGACLSIINEPLPRSISAPKKEKSSSDKNI